MLFESLNNRFYGLMALESKVAPSYDRVILSRRIDAVKTLSTAGTHDGVIAAQFWGYYFLVCFACTCYGNRKSCYKGPETPMIRSPTNTYRITIIHIYSQYQSLHSTYLLSQYEVHCTSPTSLFYIDL